MTRIALAIGLYVAMVANGMSCSKRGTAWNEVQMAGRYAVYYGSDLQHIRNVYGLPRNILLMAEYVLGDSVDSDLLVAEALDGFFYKSHPGGWWRASKSEDGIQLTISLQSNNNWVSLTVAPWQKGFALGTATIGGDVHPPEQQSISIVLIRL